MTMFRIQAHIDQESDISMLYSHMQYVAVYRHYTALTVCWWALTKEKAERYFIDLLEEHNIEWSGIFVKELLRGSV